MLSSAFNSTVGKAGEHKINNQKTSAIWLPHPVVIPDWLITHLPRQMTRQTCSNSAASRLAHLPLLAWPLQPQENQAWSSVCKGGMVAYAEHMEGTLVRIVQSPPLSPLPPVQSAGSESQTLSLPRLSNLC